MKKSEFKKIIKESIREVLLEENILSSAIFEIAKNYMSNKSTFLSEQKSSEQQKIEEEVKHSKKFVENQRRKLEEVREKMTAAIGKSSYKDLYNLDVNNLFEGTVPLTSAGSPGSTESPDSPLSGIDPGDSGVDISSFVGKSNIWKDLISK